MLRILLAFLLLPTLALAQPSEVTIWYLGHCGYAVQTEHHFLLFDYIELEETPTERGLDAGFIDPAEIADRSVTVFVTHPHIDHYDACILDWAQTIPDLDYVFGWEMEPGPHRHFLSTPRASLKLKGMTIHTVPSHHSGVPEVGYLVRVDGLVLFHAGDYQGRPGRGAPSNAVEDMRWLRAKAGRVDILFLGAWTGEPYPDIVRGLEPARIFPMHERKHEERYPAFAEQLRALGFTQPVLSPTRRGERFVLKWDGD